MIIIAATIATAFDVRNATGCFPGHDRRLLMPLQLLKPKRKLGKLLCSVCVR